MCFSLPMFSFVPLALLVLDTIMQHLYSKCLCQPSWECKLSLPSGLQYIVLYRLQLKRAIICKSYRNCYDDGRLVRLSKSTQQWPFNLGAPVSFSCVCICAVVQRFRFYLWVVPARQVLKFVIFGGKST